MSEDVPVRTHDIATAMREAYRQPEWAIFFEVANGTGANARRHADAVAMNMRYYGACSGRLALRNLIALGLESLAI